MDEFNLSSIVTKFAYYEEYPDELKIRDKKMGPFEWFPVPEGLPKLEETLWYWNCG